MKIYRMRNAIYLVSVLLLNGEVVAEDVNWTSQEHLQAAIWMQSDEYRVSAEQVFSSATALLPRLILDRAALYGQGITFDAADHLRPPAVILDIDTVLDSSYFVAQLLRNHAEYSEEAWNDWMESSSAPAIPGAKRFVEEAIRLGARVFYISNRECRQTTKSKTNSCPQKAATMRNLNALGFPNASDPNSYLFRNERAEWRAASKASRRSAISRRYQIVATVGDDISDFVDRTDYSAHREMFVPLFGAGWFLLPNALHRSWELMTVDVPCTSGMSSSSCARSRLDREYSLLVTDPPAPSPSISSSALAPKSTTRDWEAEGSLSKLSVGAIIAGIVGAIGGLVGVFSLWENWKRNFREAIFKCNESYLKVMDCKSKAKESGSYSTYWDSYRMLFDLQWTEFQLWRYRTLPTSQYRVWLNQRKRDFDEPATVLNESGAERSISYAIVWSELKQGYYDKNDPFVTHLEAVHNNDIQGALLDRKGLLKRQTEALLK